MGPRFLQCLGEQKGKARAMGRAREITKARRRFSREFDTERGTEGVGEEKRSPFVPGACRFRPLKKNLVGLFQTCYTDRKGGLWGSDGVPAETVAKGQSTLRGTRPAPKGFGWRGRGQNTTRGARKSTRTKIPAPGPVAPYGLRN